MNAPEPTPFTAEGPQPLLREIPPGETYPAHALGPLQAAVEAVQDITQAPAAIAAQSALSVASLAVQGFAWDTLGMKFRAFLDFGCGWLDWRPAQQVPAS